MDLEKYIEYAITSITKGVDNASRLSEEYDIHLKVQKEQHKTVEFDIATIVSKESEKEAGVGVKVLGISDIKGKLLWKNKSACISRLKFGVNINKKSNRIIQGP